jgi:F-type H+-transporting ATPase subunit epsilon
VAIHGGFVEVSANQVSILSDVAELGADVDVARAREALERAQGATRTDEDAEQVELAARRAQARIDAADHA